MFESWYAFRAQFRKELLLGMRRKEDLLYPFVFLLLIALFFPFIVENDKQMLQLMAPGAIWISILMAVSLTQDQIFKHDFSNDSLTQMLITPYSLSLLVFAKILANIILVTVPMLLGSIVMAILLFLPKEALPVLMFTVIIGIPILISLGAILSALAADLQGGSILLPLLSLPLWLPVLIFTSSAVTDAINHLPYAGQLYLLGSMLVLSISLSPFATATVLKLRLNT